MEKEINQVTLFQIAATFFMIGATGFGGGMAIVALVERRCVLEKKWLKHDEFLHGLAFGQILGPFSLNVSTFVGYYLRGTIGGILAAASFIAPSFLLVSALIWRSLIHRSRDRTARWRAKEFVLLLLGVVSVLACLVLMLMVMGNTQGSIAPLSLTLFFA